ncbi:hypothetical protein SUGI_0942290 [Cryptomeria japonica]|nr:hypothetical protein SUGI_0942290 [Cryptomeria japonica]
MEERRASSCLSLFLAVTIFIHLKSYGAAVQAGDTLSLGSSLAGNQTLISKNGTFELGFFSPNGGSNWYIGIWYANIEEKTIVWVANRETPARNKSGILKLSRQGKLRLFDAEGASIWSVSISRKACRAVILDSGNFLMLSDDNEQETVWQSFDNPVDSLLPGMRFGGQQKLVSWKNSLDPAPGLFSFHMDPSGAKQLVLTWNNSVHYWKSGTWDVNAFSGIPEMVIEGLYNVSVENTSSGLYVSYKLLHNINGFSRVVLTKSGDNGEALYDGSTWNIFWSVPRDECAVYGLCGAYGICNSNNLKFCSCVEGFSPKDNRAWDSKEWWSSGCVRQSPLNCSTDRFIDSNAKLSNDYASSYRPGRTKKDCEKACLRNCSCTAYTFNTPSGPCQIWSGNLLNLRSSPPKSNSNVFIRVAASALPYSSKFKTILPLVFGIAIALAITLGIFSFLMWRRRYRLRPVENCSDSSNSFLRVFSYKELKIATRNFRFKLGSGGFGSVFKGSLTDGTLVAVKILEGSRQDDKQFRAEISSLGNIQHANLIRLRGFCAQGSRRLLVYDYMPNSSLNSLLFTSNSKSRRKGNTISIVEEGVAEEKDIEEVRRVIVVALLCIERDEEVRPSMEQVVLMLEGNIEPQAPRISSSAHMDKQANGSDSDSDSNSNGDVIKLE